MTALKIALPCATLPLPSDHQRDGGRPPCLNVWFDSINGATVILEIKEFEDDQDRAKGRIRKTMRYKRMLFSLVLGQTEKSELPGGVRSTVRVIAKRPLCRNFELCLP